MVTLVRLLLVIGVAVGAVYGAMAGIVAAVRPQPREIVEAVALPRQVADVRTGRSAAETLDSQAALLVHRDRKGRRDPR